MQPGPETDTKPHAFYGGKKWQILFGGDLGNIITNTLWLQKFVGVSPVIGLNCRRVQEKRLYNIDGRFKEKYGMWGCN